MRTFHGLLNELERYKFGSEIHYRLMELQNRLQQLKESEMEVGNGFLLTPFYVHNDKRLEIYFAELCVEVNSERGSLGENELRSVNDRKLLNANLDFTDWRKYFYFRLCSGENLGKDVLIGYTRLLMADVKVREYVLDSFVRFEEIHDIDIEDFYFSVC